MTDLKLPAVAKSFYTFCKKCDADRYHVVLAHASATSAKIQCEICKSRKTYSLPKTQERAVVKRVSAATGAPRRATSHTGEYELYLKKYAETEAVPFSVRAKFDENQKINHPKFGVGFVQKAYSDKIDVIFSDEVKSLVHNR